MCRQLQDLPGSRAIFIARVIDVWPAREVVAEEAHLSQLQLRRLILSRWHGTLTAKEEQYVRTSPEWGKIQSRYAWLQRVSIVTTDVFAGPELHEVYTEASDCGYRFEAGRTYLVNASVDGPRYRTGACTRTGPVQSQEAIEDLKALRAWKSGHPLAPRIYGWIHPSDLRPDTRLSLVGLREVPVSPDGSFSFDGLTKAEYRLRIQDARGTGDRVIDLRRLGCFETLPSFHNGWSIAGSPVLIEVTTPKIADPSPVAPPHY